MNFQNQYFDMKISYYKYVFNLNICPSKLFILIVITTRVMEALNLKFIFTYYDSTFPRFRKNVLETLRQKAREKSKL